MKKLMLYGVQLLCRCMQKHRFCTPKLVIMYGIAVLLCCSSVVSYGMFSVGITVGQDLYTVNYDSVDVFRLQGPVADTAYMNLVRDEIFDPLLVGAKFCLDVIPVLDLEIGADVGFKKYHYKYESYGTAKDTVSGDAGFIRIGLFLTLKKDLFSFPPEVSAFFFYAGVGGNVQFMTPVLSSFLIYDVIEPPNYKFDIGKLLKSSTKTGGHILLGLKLKPPVTPISIDATWRYTFIKKGEYKEPGSHQAFYAGLSYNM
ncbi:hypothetical protein KAW65_06275 [candidate division WOR-3 bacterium]|nr:hypothetical protein [candidate division WOR-3 bacterium]